MFRWRERRYQRPPCSLWQSKYLTSNLRVLKNTFSSSTSCSCVHLGCHDIVQGLTHLMCSPGPSSHWLCSHGSLGPHAPASRTRPASCSRGTVLPPAGQCTTLQRMRGTIMSAECSPKFFTQFTTLHWQNYLISITFLRLIHPCSDTPMARTDDHNWSNGFSDNACKLEIRSNS